VLTNVKAFYSSYLATTPPSSAYLTTAVQSGLLTQAADNLITSKQYDLPTCSQNPLTYKDYSFSTPIITGSTASMSVSGTYSGPPAQTAKIDLSLQDVANKWAISGFSCPNL